MYGSVLHELSTWMARRSSSSQYVCVGLGSPRIFFEKLGLVSVELLMKISLLSPINSGNICLKMVWRIQSLNLIHNPKWAS